MTGTCAYCDRAVYMVIGDEPRCDWHVVPARLPLRVLAFARDRRYTPALSRPLGAPGHDSARAHSGGRREAGVVPPTERNQTPEAP